MTITHRVSDYRRRFDRPNDTSGVFRPPAAPSCRFARPNAELRRQWPSSTASTASTRSRRRDEGSPQHGGDRHAGAPARPMRHDCRRSAHLLIEKTSEHEPDGIDKLQDLIRQNGLVTAVAYVWRASPILREMKEMLDSGRFGRPLHLTVNCGQHFPTYRPAYREIYYKDHALGGGGHPRRHDSHAQCGPMARRPDRSLDGRCGAPGARRGRGGRYRQRAHSPAGGRSVVTV